MEVSVGNPIDTLSDFLAASAPVFDLLPDSVRVVDLDGTPHYFNRAFLQMTGFSPSEILNQKLDDTYVEADRERVWNTFLGVKKMGSTVGTVEVRILRKGGDPLMVSLKAILIRNAAKEPIGALGIFRDVTKMERILAEPMELLSLSGSPVEILRQLPVRLASYFPGRSWVMINLVEGDYLRFAYSINVPTEVVALGGEPLAGSICAIPIASGQPLVIADMTEDERVRQDVCVTQYGCRGYLGYPIIHSSGRVLGTLCVLRNNRGGFGEYDHRLLEMTARRAASQLEQLEFETRLQEAEKDLLDLVKHAPLMIWRIFSDGRIEMMSAKGRKDLGLAVDEKMKETLFDHTHPEDIPEFRSRIESMSGLKNGSKAASMQIRFRKADQSYGIFFLSLRPVYDALDRLKLIEGIGFEISSEN